MANPLSKAELDDLRKLNPPDDPRMFRRFLDTIDALEAELTEAKRQLNQECNKPAPEGLGE